MPLKNWNDDVTPFTGTIGQDPAIKTEGLPEHGRRVKAELIQPTPEGAEKEEFIVEPISPARPTAPISREAFASRPKK